MWNRKELKRQAKAALYYNYWKCVLVALLAVVLIGGIGGFNYRSHSSSSNHKEKNQTKNVQMMDKSDKSESVDLKMDHLETTLFVVIGIAVLAIGVFVTAIVLLINFFIINPLDVGAKRFFSHSIVQRAEVKEVAYAFDHSYKNVVKTLALRDVYMLLWLLLLIIPGIVKRYEYLMIPYLLTEHPEMERKEAFAMSRDMMRGNKWKAFVLDLSFLGWLILCGLTLGIVGIFYVAPYVYLTRAALFRKLMGYDRRVENEVW